MSCSKVLLTLDRPRIKFRNCFLWPVLVPGGGNEKEREGRGTGGGVDE